MGKLFRLILWFFLLLIFVISIAFSLVNKTTVPLSFGFIVFSPQPISVWVISAFCLGALCGLILGVGMLGSRLNIRHLKKKLMERDAQIESLNTQRRSNS